MWKDKPVSQLTFKNIIGIISYLFLLVLAIVKLDLLISLIQSFASLLVPFIMAFVIAFIFQLPMKFFLKKLPDKIKKGRILLAAFLSLSCIIALFVFVISIVVPQLIDSITMLISDFPTYAEKSQKMAMMFAEKWNIDQTVLAQIELYSAEIKEMILSFAQSALPKIIAMTSGMIVTITNVVMAIVIAVYFTVSKDTLLSQCRRFFHAFMKEDHYNYAHHVVTLANSTFSNFLSGQMVEALIIGILCYIGAMILRLEYAPILAVVIGCTNIIPIFGPIIGTAICAILLVFVNPVHAVIFVIFGILLQQFESNLIYPHVVGNSVGLSGLWVLLAVSVGGGLFGVIGMVFGLPVFAVLYRLLAEEVNRRDARKGNQEVVHGEK